MSDNNSNSKKITKKIASALGIVGVIAVEMFVCENEKILVNEIAPRPHNSGHFSLDACNVSQFDQQVLALIGRDLEDIRLEKNAVMLNLLGDLWLHNGEIKTPKFEEVEGKDINIHLYGKDTPRIGRKMGHITLVGDNIENLIIKAEEIRSKLWR